MSTCYRKHTILPCWWSFSPEEGHEGLMGSHLCPSSRLCDSCTFTGRLVISTASDGLATAPAGATRAGRCVCGLFCTRK